MNMVPRWNKLSLRVFTTVPRRSSEEAMEAQSVVVQRMLQLLRIRAKSIVIQVRKKYTRLFFLKKVIKRFKINSTRLHIY